MLFCAVLVSIAFGQSNLLKKVQGLYLNSTSIETQFTLKIFWSAREREEIKNGSLKALQSGKFNISVGKDAYVCDGKSFWQYSQVTNQVIIKAASALDPSTNPMKILSNYIYKPFKEVGSDKGKTKFEWVNTADTIPYKKIKISVSQNGIVKELEITDRQDNIQTYSFKNTVFGKKYSKEAFTFAIPTSAEILDMRK